MHLAANVQQIQAVPHALDQIWYVLQHVLREYLGEYPRLYCDLTSVRLYLLTPLNGADITVPIWVLVLVDVHIDAVIAPITARSQIKS
jgi:hypothetical protein